MSQDALSTLSTVSKHADAIGITLPDAVAEVIELRDAMHEALFARPASTLLADMLAGKVNARNVGAAITEAVAALEVTERRHALAPDMNQALDRLARRALLGDGDEIVRLCRPAFDRAAATVTAVTEALGVTVEVASLSTASPGVLASWQGRAEALSVLDHVRRLRDALGAAGYGRGDVAPVTNWIASARNADDLARAGQAFRGGERFAGVVGAGFVLRFNTATEAAEVAAIASAATARAAEEAKAKALEDTKNDPYVRELKRFADSIGQPA